MKALGWTIDETRTTAETRVQDADATFTVEVRAEVLLNADHRRYSRETRQHSEEMRGAGAAAFPELDERRCAHLAGLLHCVGSSQSWLRMREEFGVPGTESGPLVRLAVDTLISEVAERGLPAIPPTDHEQRGDP